MTEQSTAPQEPPRGAKPPTVPAERSILEPEALSRLRQFHLGGRNAGGAPQGVLPLHLAPFRDLGSVRTDYPLLLEPTGDGQSSPPYRPLSSFLEAAADSEQVGRTLRDNLLRWELRAREMLRARPTPFARPAHLLLAEALRSMAESLGLATSERKQLEEEGERLVALLAEESALLDDDPKTPLFLFAHLATAGRRRQGVLWSAELHPLIQGLRALLDVDRRKRPEGRAAEAIAGGLGSAGSSLIDPGALAQRLDGRSLPAAMDGAQRTRVETWLERLQQLEAEVQGMAEGASPMLHLLCDPTIRDLVPGLDAADSEESGWSVEWLEEPLREAAERFDRSAAAVSQGLAAARGAKLDLQGEFDEERHTPWLERFDWQAFSEEELRLVPPVVVLLSAEAVADRALAPLSRLLLSGRPVQILLLVDPAANPGGGERPLEGFRFELGYLGVGHRDAFVAQSSTAQPLAMAESFARGLQATRTGLQVVAGSGSSELGLPPGMVAGAAVEGRAHPLFLFDPEAGASWARRLDVSANPERQADWPAAEVTTGDGEDESRLEACFTFADFALLHPQYAEHFELLEPGSDHDDLVPIAEWLELDADETPHRLPFVWGVDADGLLRRLVVSRQLALACRDRLDFWHTLQELAGIHNEHVETASALVEREWQTRLEALRAELEEKHAAELEAVRAGAAEEVVERLAASLLGETEDLAALVGEGRAPAAVSPAPPTPAEREAEGKPAEAPAEPEEPEQAEEAAPADEEMEPWIDTPLCTSCNDCININPLVFAYDQDKKAYIKDPRAGTFAQLVEAAEKCPARIIHPGTPLDPSEPGLEELVERARKFA